MSNQMSLSGLGEIYLLGAIDLFISPRIISGWVKNSAHEGDGTDIVISIHFNDRLVARGSPDHRREGIVADLGYLAGFRLSCYEDIPDFAVALNLLRVTAQDGKGRRGDLSIWEQTRAQAFVNVMQYLPPFGSVEAAAILSFLGKSEKLPEQVRNVILDVRDKHVESPDRQLWSRVESLGRDCTLGLLQRAYGVEPLGLLRFSSLTIENVIDAMKNRFEGVGGADYTWLKVEAGGEYMTLDKRFHMASHTYVMQNEVDYDSFYKQQCRRLSFLARNIMEKLTEGDKLFVVHDLPNKISEERKMSLLAAMREIGPAPLLCVEAATEEHPPGTVAASEHGVLTGYVTPSLKGPTDVSIEIRQPWLEVCYKAVEMTLEKRG